MKAQPGLRNVTRGTQLANRVLVADRWWERLRGLIGQPPLPPGDGVLLSPCQSVHTWGMRYPIDVVFLDDQHRVVALYPALPPRRLTRWHRSARFALELPVSTLGASGTQQGDVLAPSSPAPS
ncbi:MAG: DUF192 domain-containing protein [Gemmatimonadetes bacterium]|nr:DUF192 domain-containing protein [Gemmatimonadota bacterium]